jgi:hypothetical protein
MLSRNEAYALIELIERQQGQGDPSFQRGAPYVTCTHEDDANRSQVGRAEPFTALVLRRLSPQSINKIRPIDKMPLG